MQRYLAWWLRKQGWRVEVEKTVRGFDCNGTPRGGRLDILAKRDGRTVIIEVKTGYVLSPIGKAIRQLEKYAHSFAQPELILAMPSLPSKKGQAILKAKGIGFCLIKEQPEF